MTLPADLNYLQQLVPFTSPQGVLTTAGMRWQQAVVQSLLGLDALLAALIAAPTEPDPGSITLAMMADLAAERLIGRGEGGGTGVPQALTLGTGLSLSGTVLSASGGLAALTQIDFAAATGAAVAFTDIPPLYRRLYVVGRAITGTASKVITWEASATNGSSYGAICATAAISLSSTHIIAEAFNAGVPDGDSGEMTAGRLDCGALAGVVGVTALAGPADAVRVSIGGGGSFSAGIFYLLGET